MLSYGKYSWGLVPLLKPNSFRTPGYPAFIALIYSFVGTKPLIIAITQILIGLFTIFLVYSIGKKYWNQQVGFAASLLLAIDLGAIIFCNQLMAETLYALFLIIGIYFLVFNPKSFLAGIMFGIGALLKPVGLYIPFFLFLCLTSFLKGDSSRE